MPLTPLGELLAELERRWREKGSPQGDRLRLGLPPDVVRRSLWLPAPAEIIDWFGWHDGPVAPRENVVLAPSSFRPLGLEGSLWARAYLECAAHTLATSRLYPGEPSDPEYFWHKNWLPLGDRETSWLVADLGSNSDSAPVLEVVWDNDEFRTVRAESLSSMVEMWLEAPDDYWSWIPEADAWRMDGKLIPDDMLRSRLY